MSDDENDMNTGPSDTDSTDADPGDAEVGQTDPGDAPESVKPEPGEAAQEDADLSDADAADTDGDDSADDAKGEVEAGASAAAPETITGDADTENSEGGNFVRWDESNLTQVPHSNLAHRTVVKKRFVENEPPIKITPAIPKSRLHSRDDADITPILQDEQIVGVKVACHCGSVHEIMFNFLPS